MTVVEDGSVTLHGGEHTHPATARSLLETLEQRNCDVVAVEQPYENLRTFIQGTPYRYDGRDVRAAYTYAEQHELPLAAIDQHHDIDERLVERGDRLMSAALLAAANIPPAEASAVSEGELLGLPLRAIRTARTLYRTDDPEVFDAVVDSRDKAMAGRIRGLQEAGYSDIVAVVGQAHLPGVYDYLQDEAWTTTPPIVEP